MPTHRRYKAPAENGAVLADPPVDQWPALVDANRRLLDCADVTIGGMPLRDLRRLARRELLAAAVAYTGSLPGWRGGPPPDAPFVLAGHQPELSHPGVWVKHFALNGLACRVGGVPVNLVVDNDTLKSAALRLPVYDPRNPVAVHTQSIPFDTFEAELPYEDRGVNDPELFRTFADRAAAVWKSWGYEPLLPGVWADVLNCPGAKTGERFAAARRYREWKWGCNNLELPVSQIAGLDSFAVFAGHLLSDLSRLHEAYNAAVRDYRNAHGIRSRNHPAPELEARDRWFEVPLWWWDSGARRHRAFAQATESGIRIRAAEGHPFSASPNPQSAFKAWQQVAAPDSRLRPRALTLTLFARLVLGDFFIHGIGGGKYDEVTDRIIRDYFGVEPPRYAVLSATLHLPLPHYPHSAADARDVARRLRDLYWNPQRYAGDDSGADRLRREKAALVAAEPPRTDPAARKRWFRDLQTVTEHLRPLVADDIARAGRQLTEARAEAHANAVLTRRDYSWVLYPEATLRPFLARFL